MTTAAATKAAKATSAAAPRPSDALDAPRLLELFRQMLVIRRFEERCMQSYMQQKIGGFCHIYIGQEAVAVGTIASLNGDDPIITAYRDHGHALARGMHPNHAMAELFGKLTGCAKGKGGSMHFFDKAHHMYGGHAIVGGQAPLGVGLAFAHHYEVEVMGTGSRKVTVCYFGDGALNQGAIHEAMNLAAIWKLPIIFVCENNRYSMGTAIERGTSMADDLSVKAAAYGMRFEKLDGMDVLKTYDVFKPLVDAVRDGGGPAFVDAQCYRYKGHSMSDPQKYRSKEEVSEYEAGDPIHKLTQHLVGKKLATQDELDAIDAEAKKLATDSVKYATESPEPGVDELFTDVYTQPYGEPYKVGDLPIMLREGEEERP